MACAVRVPGVHSFMVLVFRQAARADHAVHLGAGNLAAIEDGSVDELCLEIHAADVARQYHRGRSLAFHADRLGAMAGLFLSGRWSLPPARSRIDGRKEMGETNLPLCRMNALNRHTVKSLHRL